jgi:hypothetical protein
MYQFTWSRLPNVVIAAGQQVSNVVNIMDIYDAQAIVLQAPAALDAGTYTLETSGDGQAWGTLLYPQSGGNMPVPAANQSRVYSDLPQAGSFRIRCSVVSASERIFLAGKSIPAG